MKFKTFKEFLSEKGHNEEAYKALEVAQKAELRKNYESYSQEEIAKAISEKQDKAQIQVMIDKSLEGLSELATKTQLEDLTSKLEAQGLAIAGLKNKGVMNIETVTKQVNNFIESNFDKIQQIKSSGQGVISLNIKAPETITTGSSTLPASVPNLQGVQVAPPTNVNLRTDTILGLTSNISTNQASYAYTETVPKDGDFTFLGEGEIKPQVDFTIRTEYAKPLKTAAWIKLTDESIRDIPQMQSIANDFLRKKHDRKKSKGILTGDGQGQNPKGAITHGRLFASGTMANKVASPNFMDAVNACITDIYTTHNYEDEMNYIANTVLVNPVDFFVNLVSAKDGDGKPLYPTASLFNQVVIGGAVIMPEEDIESGKIFVADMTKYNTTNYVPYSVQIGYVNDDFIKNQFVILGESRFHAFVKRLDEQAFIYDDIATIKTAIAEA